MSPGTSPGTSPAASPRRTALAVLLATATIGLAACGSQIAPETVAAANGTAASGGEVAQVDLAGAATTGGDTEGTAGADTGVDASSAGSGPTTADASSPDTASGSTGGDRTASGPGSDGGDAPGAADCPGLANQTGITADTITIANISDISGPVPGVFQSAQDATNAFAAFVNASGGVCGRKLDVLQLDSRADSGANQVAYARACDEAFAAVGSMSVFDQGARTAGECGLPDIHALTVSPEAFECDTCFGAAAINPHLQIGAMAKYVLQRYGDAAQKAAVLYVNVNGVADAAKALGEAWKKAGVGIQYVQAIDVAEFNYAPYVQKLKDEGIKIVHYIGPYQFTVRLQQAMQQQQYTPTAFIQDQTIYDQKYVDEAGDVGNGTVVYGSTDLFTNKANAEMQRYLAWLQQVRPGAEPTPYGVYSWSAGRLFVDLVSKLGGRLTRASLVAALRQVSQWTGHGLTAAQDVGGKRTGECIKVIQLNDGVWKQISPGDFYCAPSIPIG
ncbi:ABC transporter substrate-binding protein [Nocardioides fonticola]|uniref:ABC transporter substrate-binding protein n=1 Tax=Nocardioides fonticola TaxID=450363 RepID=UPI0031E40382